VESTERVAELRTQLPELDDEIERQVVELRRALDQRMRAEAELNRALRLAGNTHGPGVGVLPTLRQYLAISLPRYVADARNGYADGASPGHHDPHGGASLRRRDPMTPSE